MQTILHTFRDKPLACFRADGIRAQKRTYVDGIGAGGYSGFR